MAGIIGDAVIEEIRVIVKEELENKQMEDVDKITKKLISKLDEMVSKAVKSHLTAISQFVITSMGGNENAEDSRSQNVL